MDDLFQDLPPEIFINILCRLPIKTVTCCKCVNKSWLHLLQTSEFINSHLSKSLPGLINFQIKRGYHYSESIKLYELVDELQLCSHELHYNPIVEIDINEFITPTDSSKGVEGSIDGLLFLRTIYPKPDAFYVCNPITRECIVLPEIGGVFHYPGIVTYGFGKSKMSGLYKVVRIFHERVLDPDTHMLLSIPRSECQVYTLGTGTWRSIAHAYSHEYNCRSNGTLVDGKLHWLVMDLKGKLLISCFDLETEKFSMFSSPVLNIQTLSSLTALDNCLCVCDNTSETEILIWIMKEYGVEKSWNKKFVISKVPDFAGEYYEVVYPLQVFKDGDILMLWDEFHLFYYSSKTKFTAKIDSFRPENFCFLEARLHVPSFVSLKSFVMENVRSF